MIEPLPSRTMYVPIIEVMMHRPPMISGRLISFISMSPAPPVTVSAIDTMVTPSVTT